MNTSKLEALIGQVQELNTKLAGIDVDEAQFTRDRQAVIDGGDYTAPSVAKVTELDTRLAIIPGARARLQGQLDAAHQALRNEVRAQGGAFAQDINAQIEKTQAAVAKALEPFSEGPESALNLAVRSDAVGRLRQDMQAVFGIGSGGNLAVEETVGSAQLLIKLSEAFAKNGRLPL